VEARDEIKKSALHHAVVQADFVTVLELVLEHDANMFAVGSDGKTPFDLACDFEKTGVVSFLIETYGRRLTQNHGPLALHAILGAADYSFAEAQRFHPPLNPIEIILPLGRLTFKHFDTLLQHFDTELIRNRDDSGKLPIHTACRNNAPVEVFGFDSGA
jgi:hypothetical protein